MQILNRKAHFNYHIESEIEAGIMLLGSEVKSIRQGKISLSESYIAESNNEFFLINANISEYSSANKFNHEPKRKRKLLLHKKQIIKILARVKTENISLIPTKIFFNHKNFAKIMIGIAKGKKLFDKREAIKERDEKRRNQRGDE